MQVETLMFAGWVAVPLIAYAGGRVAVSRTGRRGATRTAPDAQERLAQLRRSRESGRVTKGGRMADALRLAEGAGALAAPEVRQP